MKYLLLREKIQRLRFKQIEKKKVLLKSISVNKFLDLEIRGFAQDLMKRKVYKTVIKNYCLLTTRSRGIIRKYNLSRMSFKKYVGFGYLKGIKKGSW